ncbi:MAG: group II intron maturase-specific domain-containing protein, partial [Pseudonocardiales bacterium]
QGRNFSNFLPAISKDALNRISAEVRSWRLHRRTGCTFKDLARRINPIVAGWMHYYGAFYRSALYPLLSRINAYLVGWIRKKYKRLRGKKKARVPARDHRKVSPDVHALEMGRFGPARLTTRMTRAG